MLLSLLYMSLRTWKNFELLLYIEAAFESSCMLWEWKNSELFSLYNRGHWTQKNSELSSCTEVVGPEKFRVSSYIEVMGPEKFRALTLYRSCGTLNKSELARCESSYMLRILEKFQDHLLYRDRGRSTERSEGGVVNALGNG